MNLQHKGLLLQDWLFRLGLWQNFFYHICEDFRLQANKARPYYVRLLTLERGGNDKEKTRPFNLHADFSRVLPLRKFVMEEWLAVSSS